MITLALFISAVNFLKRLPRQHEVTKMKSRITQTAGAGASSGREKSARCGPQHCHLRPTYVPLGLCVTPHQAGLCSCSSVPAAAEAYPVLRGSSLRLQIFAFALLVFCIDIHRLYCFLWISSLSYVDCKGLWDPKPHGDMPSPQHLILLRPWA